MKLRTSLILLLIASCAAWAQTPVKPAKAPAAKPAATKAPEAKAPAAKAPAAKAPEAKAPAAKAPAAKAPAAKAPAAKAPAAKAPAAKAPAAKAPAAKAPAPQAAATKAPVSKAAATKAAADKTAAPAKKRGKGVQRRATAQQKTPAKPEAKTPPATPSATPKIVARRGRDPFLSIVKKGMSPCATGKQCLAIGEIVVKGVARTQSGMIAMVENSMRKAYMLRENDPVFNGFVLKIDMDSVVLRENVLDKNGRPTTRDVVKKVGPLMPAIPVG